MKIDAISSIQSFKNQKPVNFGYPRKRDRHCLNVLSLLGAKIEHVYNFIPKKDLYDIIVLFIGGNNLFVTTSENLVRQISDLAYLLTKAKKVFVLGIPLRNFQPHQAKEVNSLLASCQEGWNLK